MRPFIIALRGILELLNAASPWLAVVLLRILIGWEFLDSGLEKFQGENWFAEIQDRFPFPFNIVPTDISWAMATGFELVGGIGLIVGLGTRFFSVTLIILTVVATAAVHWPAEWHTLADLAKGYVISDDGHGNFKLPVIYLTMLTTLIFTGSGKLGLDAAIAWKAKGAMAAVRIPAEDTRAGD